jgi:hypothetical protein
MRCNNPASPGLRDSWRTVTVGRRLPAEPPRSARTRPASARVRAATRLPFVTRNHALVDRQGSDSMRPDWQNRVLGRRSAHVALLPLRSGPMPMERLTLRDSCQTWIPFKNKKLIYGECHNGATTVAERRRSTAFLCQTPALATPIGDGSLRASGRPVSRARAAAVRGPRPRSRSPAPRRGRGPRETAGR